MKVSQLIKKLQKANPNSLVVLASDAEGNGFSSLRNCDTSCLYNNYLVFDSETREVGISELTPKLKKYGFDEEDVIKGEPAVILYPN